ncbi:hypothetical protein [Actibacterium sp. 188UL27-1]|uniref:hypothetical protein n=1 Tax=Actibacterium sp. 188UL27-1 TaxID=2786961 RepID=UPI0019597C67|nr:hypothetical protein [Actibacterium sp. 188UL27-1]MBM7066778.1 hypothetical protein [Actibacterium sp. 188UL27-1]
MFALRLKGTAAAIISSLLISASSALAIPVGYEFTDTLGRTGMFEFEHDAQSQGRGLHGGRAYPLATFIIDGQSFADPEISIFTNFHGNQFAVAAAPERNFVQLGHFGKGLFSSTDLSELFDLKLSDFNMSGFNFVNMDDGALSVVASLRKISNNSAPIEPEPPVSSEPEPPVSPVPLPASLPLLIAGIGGMLLLLRRQRMR